MQTIVYGKDYPVFFFIFVATATIMYKFIFQTKVSSNAKKVYAEKRKIIISAMNTALNWKQSAVQLRNTKVKEIEEKIERNDIAKNCKGVKTDKMENVDPDNELKKSQEQIEYELQEQIPAPEKIYELLFCENERYSSKRFGIPDEKMKNVEGLLLDSLSKTLNSYVKKTLQARKPKQYPLLSWQTHSEVLPFRDGQRLKRLVQHTEKEVRKNYGKHVVPKGALEKANETLRNIRIERRHGCKLLLSLSAPS